MVEESASMYAIKGSFEIDEAHVESFFCRLAKCSAEWVRKVPSRVPLCVLHPNCGVRLSRRGVSRIAVSTMTEKSLASVMGRCMGL